VATPLYTSPTLRRNETMRPQTEESAVLVVCQEIPQFVDVFHDLREIYGEDLTPEVVFNEFADFVQTLIDDDEEVELIERCFALVEKLLRTDREDVWPLVGYSFLDTFRPDALYAASQYIGPATETLMRRLATRWWDYRDEPLSAQDLADIDDLVARGYLSC
jgi:hypothetical protein